MQLTPAHQNGTCRRRVPRTRSQSLVKDTIPVNKPNKQLNSHRQMYEGDAWLVSRRIIDTVFNVICLIIEPRAWFSCKPNMNIC
jgi:hypothetical protein